MSLYPITLQYELIADGVYIINATESHRDGMPYGNYSFNVSCYNNLSYDNATVNNSVSINKYSTNLVIENETGKSTGEKVNFYANYTSTLMPVSGIGLNDYEIGQIIWNTSDIDTLSDTFSIAFFDCENKCINSEESPLHPVPDPYLSYQRIPYIGERHRYLS